LTTAECDEAIACFATGVASAPEIDVIANAPTAAMIAEAERGNVVMTGTFRFRSRCAETRSLGGAGQPLRAHPRRDATLMLEMNQAWTSESGGFADQTKRSSRLLNEICDRTAATTAV
jgi:hypothetical protein